MSYFRELPNISAVSLLPSASRNDERMLVKNIYKRAKLRSDLDNIIMAFDYRTIPDGYRPDNVANEIYEDPELDWVVLIVNNITNIRDQWPLSNNDLHTYMLDKYGSEENIAGVHHYETIELKDRFNRTVLQSGLEVDSSFQYTYNEYTGIGTNFSRVSIPASQSVSNFEYETRLNDTKRIIRILKPEYLPALISDMRRMMKYEKSSQFVDRITKEAYNPRETGV